MTRRQALVLLALCCALPPAPGPALAAGQEAGQELTSKGHDLFVAGKPAEAVAVLREAAKQDPSNPWLFNLLGRASFQSGDMPQAVEAFRTALRIDPGDGYSRMMLEMLSQKPLPASKGKPGEAKPREVKPKRPSHLEDEARQELQAFAASGKPPGRRTVVLDPGHGGTDRGASGPAGTIEKAVALELARKLSQALEAGGVRAVLTRDGDYDVPLWARSAMAGLFSADLFLSLHCTAAEANRDAMELYTYTPEPSGPQAHGVAELENGVTRFERKPPPAQPVPWIGEFLGSWQSSARAVASVRLASKLAAALGQGQPSGAVQAFTAPLKLLHDCASPAVLLEAGFLSAGQAEQRLKDPMELEKLAKRLAAALTESLG